MAYLHIPSRRRFVASTAALSSVGLANLLPGIGVSSALAADDGYKALVCVYLAGGNDGNNTVIPNDTAGYAGYKAVRTDASGIALAQADLAAVTMKNGAAYGLHPNLAPLKSVFDAGKLAILANVGNLAEPLTMAQYKSGSGLRPLSLFSHSDQVLQSQSAIVRDQARDGWGGRMVDLLAAQNRTAAMPSMVSFSGSPLFGTGELSRPLVLPTGGSFNTNILAARRTGLTEVLAASKDMALNNGFVASAASISGQALDLTNLVNPILAKANSAAAPAFTGQTAGIAQQLLAVAKVIEARAQTGLKRQVFFVSIGGFDTHTNQIANHGARMNEVGRALKGFYDAMVTLGVSDQVTTFTLSDFGRTFRPAAGGGSDHAWGNHNFVMGGAVKGGDMYGKFPQLTLQGPDDVASEGRWLPTTSNDQYAATLAKWFGVSASSMKDVLPNIGRFSNTDLGFMA
jgi:uncharacterized protein (DUF1501 family)